MVVYLFEVLGGEGKRWTPEPTRSYPPVATARTEASLLIPKRVIGNDQVIGLARTTCGARAGKGPDRPAPGLDRRSAFGGKPENMCSF
jgi:hypothetical protein